MTRSEPSLREELERCNGQISRLEGIFFERNKYASILSAAPDGGTAATRAAGADKSISTTPEGTSSESTHPEQASPDAETEVADQRSDLSEAHENKRGIFTESNCKGWDALLKPKA